jgi:hypothetical protein
MYLILIANKKLFRSWVYINLHFLVLTGLASRLNIHSSVLQDFSFFPRLFDNIGSTVSSKMIMHGELRGYAVVVCCFHELEIKTACHNMKIVRWY